MPGSRASSRGSCTPKPFLYGDVLVRAAEQSRIPGLPVQSLTSRAVAPARDCVGNPMDLSCFKPGLCMNPGRTFFSKNDDGRVVAYTGMSQPNHPGRIGETKVTLLAGRNSRPRSRGRSPTPKVFNAESPVSQPAFGVSHFRELIATMPPKPRRVKSKSPLPSLPAKSYKQVLWDEVSKAPGFRVLGPLVGAVEGFAGSGKTAFLVAIAAKYPTSVFVQCTLRSRSADWPCFKSSNHDKRPLKVPLWIVDEANRCSTTAEYVKAALATSTPLVLVYDRLQCETYDWLLGPAPNYLWRTYRLSPGPISDALVARYPKLQVLGQDRVPCVLPFPDADEESCLLPVAGVDGFSTNFVQLLTKQHPNPSLAFVWLYAADLVCRALGGAVWSVIEALVYSTTHVPLLGLAIKAVFGAQFSFLLFAFVYVVQFYAVTSWVHFGVPVFYTFMWGLARVLSVTVTQCPYHDVTCSARDCPAFSWLRSTITGSTDFNYAHLQGETVDEGHIHLNKFVLRNPHLLLISLTRLRRGIVFSATPLEKMKLPDFIEKRVCLPSGAFKWKLREHVPKGVRSTPTRPNLMRRQWVPPGANRLGRAIRPYGANDIRTENSMWNLWSLATLWLSYPAAVLFFT